MEADKKESNIEEGVDPEETRTLSETVASKVHVLHIILQDPVIESRNPVQPVAVCNFHNRADAW